MRSFPAPFVQFSHLLPLLLRLARICNEELRLVVLDREPVVVPLLACSGHLLYFLRIEVASQNFNHLSHIGYFCGAIPSYPRHRLTQSREDGFVHRDRSVGPSRWPVPPDHMQPHAQNTELAVAVETAYTAIRSLVGILAAQKALHATNRSVLLVQPNQAVPWISEIEKAKTLEKLFTSHSVTGTDFETLDSKILDGLIKILHGDFRWREKNTTELHMLRRMACAVLFVDGCLCEVAASQQ